MLGARRRAGLVDLAVRGIHTHPGQEKLLLTVLASVCASVICTNDTNVER